MEAEHERRTRNDGKPRTVEQEANPEREQDTEPNPDLAYQPVGSRAIVLGARLQKPAEEEEKKKNATPQQKDKPRRIRARELQNAG